MVGSPQYKVLEVLDPWIDVANMMQSPLMRAEGEISSRHSIAHVDTPKVNHSKNSVQPMLQGPIRRPLCRG